MNEVIAALYCPGNRADRFNKAMNSGADQVILDLQESVPLGEKSAALEAVLGFLGSLEAASAKKVQVRVNEGIEELPSLSKFAHLITLRIPRVEVPEQISPWIDFRQIVPLVETAKGLANLSAIAESPKVKMLAIGELDFSRELHSRHPDMIRYLRIQIVLASAAFGLRPPMMSAWTNLSDMEGLRMDTIEGRTLGFLGRVAIHPKQIPVIKEAFAVPESELRYQKEVLDLLGEEGGVAVDSDGNMVDRANLRPRSRKH